MAIVSAKPALTSDCTSIAPPPSRELPLPPVLRLYLAAFLLLSAISAIAGDILYYLNRYRDCCTLIYDEPLFVDFWHYHYIFRFFHATEFFTNSDRFAYPAPSAVVLDALYHLGPHAQAIFLGIELTACILAAAFFFREVRRIGLRVFPAAVLSFSTLVFSYPLLYMFQCGNAEIFTCMLTAGGLLALIRKRDNTAAVLWAAAGALKIYPLILFGLFLSRAKWRSLAVGAATFFAISALSMAFVGPTIHAAFAGTLNGISGFVSSYAGEARVKELSIDHSLLAPIKTVAFFHADRWGTLSYLTRPYLLIAGTAALLAFFLRVARMPLTNQVLFLFCAMVALPPVSYDYTLVHLYAPWALLVAVALRAAAAGQTLPGLRTCFLCFAVLFTSQRYIHHHWICANAPLKTGALVLLMVTALRHPIPCRINRMSSPRTT
jgi:Glycosyltransferase family 87